MTVSTIKPRRDALLVTLVVLTVATVCNMVVYFVAARGLLDEIQGSLRTLANIASLLTDGDLHQTITQREQKNSPEYLQLNAPYRMLLKADPELRYVYTAVLKDDKVYLVFDTQPESNASNPNIARKTTAEVMEEYPDATRAMRTALKEQRTVIENRPYNDEWGTFISGYAPIYNSRKECIGVIGVDIDATDFNHEMFKVRLGLLLASLIAIFFSGGIGLALYHIRKTHAEQAATRQKRIDQVNAFHSRLRERITSIFDASKIIDGKANAIAETAEQSAHRTQEAQATIRGASARFQTIADAAKHLLRVINASKAAAPSPDIARAIEEQEEVVGHIAEDIQDVTERTKTIVEMVKSIAGMAAITGSQTADIRQAMHSLYEQNTHLKSEVDDFIKKMGP